MQYYILAPQNVRELARLVKRYYGISVRPDEIDDKEIENLIFLVDLKAMEKERKTSMKILLKPGKANEFCRLLKSYKGITRNPEEFRGGLTNDEFKLFSDLRDLEALTFTLNRLAKEYEEESEEEKQDNILYSLSNALMSVQDGVIITLPEDTDIYNWVTSDTFKQLFPAVWNADADDHEYLSLAAEESDPFDDETVSKHNNDGTITLNVSKWLKGPVLDNNELRREGCFE